MANKIGRAARKTPVHGAVYEAIKAAGLSGFFGLDGKSKPKSTKPTYNMRDAAKKNRARYNSEKAAADKSMADWTYEDKNGVRTYRKKTYAEKSVEGHAPPSREAVDAMRYRSATKKSVAKAITPKKAKAKPKSKTNKKNASRRVKKSK